METYGAYTICLDNKKQFDLVLDLFKLLYDNNNTVDRFSVLKKNKGIVVEQNSGAHQARIIEELQPILKILLDYKAKDVVLNASGYVDYGDARSIFQICFEDGKASIREEDFSTDFDIEDMFEREEAIDNEEQEAYKRLNAKEKIPLEKCGWSEMVKPISGEALQNLDKGIQSIMKEYGYQKETV